ncbi:AzlC family ABC transporter permease [Exilibacterium tricleocarpae]|uniref:AzlC family ABC transporter permease n=1 Tax=Exilibacterium tricleocarpae TaxID=2591008 RepID=A0A545SM01_9GAMM|nr:AzlC family ABC transporter permease [Exilibacterium tricleocarpae]TQV65998.1 AzlC family ABC transporter permease [Exilibacterium tricleocarpae]
MPSTDTPSKVGPDTRAPRIQPFSRGAVAALPLCVAVVPWGLLTGSLAIESGLSPVQGQAMSLLVFAGAAQLVGMGLIKAGAGLGSILLTTFFISSRHLLYSMIYRQHLARQPKRWRLALGFLLTDELFALTSQPAPGAGGFNRWYAFGVGFTFYLVWNITTFFGLIAGRMIPDLNTLGLDFAIAATFIAIVVPMVKNLAVLATVATAAVLAVLCEVQQIEGGIIIAALGAMTVGFLTTGKTS